MKYLIVLFIAWLINGSLKFLVNFIVDKKTALKQVGYGGFPSTHTAIISSMLFYIALSHGWDNPAVGALFVLLWVVANDAKSLRNLVGRHSEHLNNIDKKYNHRTRVGHKLYEIIGGFFVGLLTGYITFLVL